MELFYTKLAHNDLKRLREFIGDHNPDAARRAADRIRAAGAALLEHPLIGRPVVTPEGLKREDIRELVVPFGASGYLLRYQVLAKELRVLRIWHAREDVDQPG